MPLSDSVRVWMMAARPRTLPAAIAPVLVGTALAKHDGDINWLAFAAALIGAIAIQVAFSTLRGVTSPAEVTRTGPSRSAVSAPRSASE